MAKPGRSTRALRITELYETQHGPLFGISCLRGALDSQHAACMRPPCLFVCLPACLPVRLTESFLALPASASASLHMQHVPVYDVVLMQVCQCLQQWLGQAHSHVALCVLVGVADAVVQDVPLANVLLHCRAQHNTRETMSLQELCGLLSTVQCYMHAAILEKGLECCSQTRTAYGIRDLS